MKITSCKNSKLFTASRFFLAMLGGLMLGADKPAQGVALTTPDNARGPEKYLPPLPSSLQRVFTPPAAITLESPYGRVVLVTEEGASSLRIKIWRKDGLEAGNIILEEDTPGGHVRMREKHHTSSSPTFYLMTLPKGHAVDLTCKGGKLFLRLNHMEGNLHATAGSLVVEGKKSRLHKVILHGGRSNVRLGQVQQYLVSHCGVGNVYLGRGPSSRNTSGPQALPGVASPGTTTAPPPKNPGAAPGNAEDTFLHELFQGKPGVFMVQGGGKITLGFPKEDILYFPHHPAQNNKILLHSSQFHAMVNLKVPNSVKIKILNCADKKSLDLQEQDPKKKNV